MRRVFGRVWRKCFPDSKGAVGKLGLAQMRFCSSSQAPWDRAESDQREGGELQTRSRLPLEKALAKEKKKKVAHVCTWENICPFKVK